MFSICWQSPLSALGLNREHDLRIHYGRPLPPMAKGSAAIATAIWNQNSASVNSSVASGQYLRIRDFSIAETILWFMVKCLLLLWIVYMSGLEMITVIKKLWGKVTFLKSQVLWPHCICWRRVFKKRECLIDAQSYSQVKNEKLKHHLKYHFYVSECQKSSDVGKGNTPTWWHWSVNCYTLNGNQLGNIYENQNFTCPLT